MDVHPSGEHLIVGGYDKKVCWFDLEVENKPWKVFRYDDPLRESLGCAFDLLLCRYHNRAVRAVSFHPSYPLFATSSDDGTIQLFHARVYSDLVTPPLIVPLKVLSGHDLREGLGVLDIGWCRGLPWLVSGGADGQVKIWMS